MQFIYLGKNTVLKTHKNCIALHCSDSEERCYLTLTYLDLLNVLIFSTFLFIVTFVSFKLFKRPLFSFLSLTEPICSRLASVCLPHSCRCTCCHTHNNVPHQWVTSACSRSQGLRPRGHRVATTLKISGPLICTQRPCYNNRLFLPNKHMRSVAHTPT